MRMLFTHLHLPGGSTKESTFRRQKVHRLLHIAGEILSTMSSICHAGLEYAEPALYHLHRTIRDID